MFAIQDIRYARKSRLSHHHRGHAVASAHSGEVERLFNMLRIAFPAPDPGHLLRCVGQRVPHSFFIEPGQRRCSSHGAKGRADAFRTTVGRANVVRPKGHQKPAAQVVTESHGAQKVLSRAIFSFAYTEGRRHNGAAGVGFGDRLEVIGLVGMRKHTGCKRRIHHRGAYVRSRH